MIRGNDIQCPVIDAIESKEVSPCEGSSTYLKIGMLRCVLARISVLAWSHMHITCNIGTHKTLIL